MEFEPHQRWLAVAALAAGSATALTIELAEPYCDEMVAASIAARSAITMRRSQSKDVDGIDDEQPAAIYFSRSPFPMNREYAASSKPYGE